MPAGQSWSAGVIPNYIADGQITIVLDADHAGWEVASTIAKVINEAEAQPLARANGPASVSVAVPACELPDPADFIGRVLGLPVLMPDRQARIVINERTGTIVVTEDVEIDPVLISHAGADRLGLGGQSARQRDGAPPRVRPGPRPQRPPRRPPRRAFRRPRRRASSRWTRRALPQLRSRTCWTHSTSSACP